MVAAHKVEHYEIAGYDSVRTFARVLGYRDAERLLEQTLQEESVNDEKLTEIAQRRNVRDETADQAPNV